MLAFAKIALYTWVPFVLLVFAVMKPRRAVIFAYVGGWLLLPMLAIKFAGIPDLTKITASSMGVLLGAAIFDSKTLFKFRPSWVDLPMIGWCITPMITSLVNDLGAYDGASNVVQQLAIWGIPYFIGRVYFNDLEGFKELGIGIIIGALLYLPASYLEMVISPKLHKYTYGFVQHSIAQAKRWGMFRPMVFMQSSLSLAMFMTTATLIAGWMWMTGTRKTLFHVPMIAIVAVLFVTQILCKTMAATLFMFVGFAGLYWIRTLGRSGFVAGLPILALAVFPAVYMYARGSTVVDKQVVLNVVGTIASDERLQSLEVRLRAEDLVTEQSLSAPDPIWGWGKWDPNDPRKTPWRVYLDYEGVGADGMPERKLRDIAPTDGLWIITLGQFGLSGVFFLTASIVIPAFVLWLRIPLRYWGHPAVATAAAMSLLLLLHMIDNLLNGMINSLYLLAAGGLCGMMPSIRKIARRYGPQYAEAALNATAAQPMPGAWGGFPVQPMAGQPGGYANPAGYTAMPAGYGQVPPGAFPSLAGLQSGQQPQRRRR